MVKEIESAAVGAGTGARLGGGEIEALSAVEAATEARGAVAGETGGRGEGGRIGELPHLSRLEAIANPTPASNITGNGSANLCTQEYSSANPNSTTKQTSQTYICRKSRSKWCLLYATVSAAIAKRYTDLGVLELGGSRGAPNIICNPRHSNQSR